MTYQDSKGSYFTAGQDELVSNPMLVKTQLSTVELNRMFRQMLSDGGYFEPYIGARFMSVSDNTLEDTTQNINAVSIGNRFKQNATNNALVCRSVVDTTHDAVAGELPVTVRLQQPTTSSVTSRQTSHSMVPRKRSPRATIQSNRLLRSSTVNWKSRTTSVETSRFEPAFKPCTLGTVSHEPTL